MFIVGSFLIVINFLIPISFKAVQTGENTARTMIQWPDAATAQAAVDGLRAAAMEMTDTKVVATAGGETKLDFS